MVQPIANTFTSYELSEREAVAGATLSPLTIAVIQNKRSTLAEYKLNLIFDPKEVEQYQQQVAYLQGKLDILYELLEDSKSAQQAQSDIAFTQE